MSKIYLASSWKNHHYDRILNLLRTQGHEVFDFQVQDTQIQWVDIDPEYKVWTLQKALAAHALLAANVAFQADYKALQECDVVVLLYPCGRSAHIEAGYALGQGKHVIAYVDPGHIGPIELMLKMCSKLVVTDWDLLAATANKA